MRIGYPCINRTIGCVADRTFRLRSYSEQRLIATVTNNLECLLKILEYNIDHGIRFFRLSSDLVPFASHPVNRYDWAGHFGDRFREIGDLIRSHDVRISMHPDQFILLNSPREDVFARSVAELQYHASVLDLMGLDTTARIQLHVGGVYGDKPMSMARFADRYRQLPDSVARRLVIENDDRLYTLGDCLEINVVTGIPILLDSFHHQVNCSGESLGAAMKAIEATWGETGGPPMVDYSSQAPGDRKGNHAESLDEDHFRQFLIETRPHDFDVMLEIKDKEASAICALEVAVGDSRLSQGI